MSARTCETVFSNAAIVLPHEILRGSLVVRDGRIADISAGSSRMGIDCEGDHLLPGLVELHTDQLERHYLPRPTVRWNVDAALQAHDAQIAASGITTVFDALRVGMDNDAALGLPDMRAMADAIEAGSVQAKLRAEHFVHLRCEVSAPDVLTGFETMADDARVRLVSLMDHAPGQRQFVDLATYRAYYQTKSGITDEAFEAFCARRIEESERNAPASRRSIAERCRANGIVLASHDDATPEHVAEGVMLGIALAEFPTTLEAARLSREAGMAVLMGAPNVVRGGSHSGNVPASSLAEHGLLDVLSSDYVPFSLIQAAFALSETVGLPAAVRMASRNPAEVVGLSDRGALEPGRRADLVRVHADGRGTPPVVREVWREGRRVA